MKVNINLETFKDFLKSSSGGGFILFSGVIISLLIANSPLSDSFNQLLNARLGFENDFIHLKYSILLWINDGLMVIFFLLVGLEIKRELVEGELSAPKKAILPILCAFGGAIVPALIFVIFNNGTETASGWGIPMATDIAFALAVISLLGNKVPASLKIFLAALAIVDDLIAILVIGLFYSTDINFNYLFYAGGLLVLLVVFNRFNVINLAFYLIPGAFIWYFIHHSGIHATIAGVLVALTLPTNESDEESPLEKLEHILVNPVNYLILPVFALANTNIIIESEVIGGLLSPLGVGIIAGLVVGKCLGILFTSWLGVKLGISILPAKASWQHIIGVGLLGGIGFTMSIFIAILSFDDALLISEAKFAVLVGSLLSGLFGYFTLLSTKRSGKSSGLSRPPVLR